MICKKCKEVREDCKCNEIAAVDEKVMMWRFPMCSTCSETCSSRDMDILNRLSSTCKSLGHDTQQQSILTPIIDGSFSAATHFIYATRLYVTGKYEIAYYHANKAKQDSDSSERQLDKFVKHLSTLLLTLMRDNDRYGKLSTLVSLATSLPLISLVWSTLIAHLKTIEDEDTCALATISKLSLWSDTCPATISAVLPVLEKIKNDVRMSCYIKETLLNTCGHATEWVPTIWNLDHPHHLLFTLTELISLSQTIGPLGSILKPVSTTESYEIINDFLSITRNEILERGGTCASCGVCVSTTCESNVLLFNDTVKRIFLHRNVCKATWNPVYITAASTSSKIFTRGISVTLLHCGITYNATVLYQRRGVNTEPGLVALAQTDENSFFPQHPPCTYQLDCPFYTQKHGFLTLNEKTYILLDKHDYNLEWGLTPKNQKPSLNVNSWVGAHHNILRICIKCKNDIGNDSLPRSSFAFSELPVVPPAFLTVSMPEFLEEPNLVEKSLTSCFRANSYIVKMIPSMYQKNRKNTAPGINSLGLENRPDLQKAKRGHIMTFKMPMEEIRKKFLDGGSVPGPVSPSELEYIFKFVVMNPTSSLEETMAYAAKLPIRHARKKLVIRVLKYFFTHHHPRLYPRENHEEVIRRCTSTPEDEQTCGTLVTIHRTHPDASAARRAINKSVEKGYSETHANAPASANDDGFTCSGVLPMHNHSSTFDSRLQAAAKNVLATGIITGKSVNEFKENLLLAGIHSWLFYNGRGMQKDKNRLVQYSRLQWIQLWASQSNRKFAEDFSFLFNVKDMYDRHDAYSQARIRVRSSHLVDPSHRTPEILRQIATMFAEGMDFNAVIQRHPSLVQIVRAITVTGKHISGSPFERSEFRKPMRALSTTDGTASIWATINLSDVSSPQLALFTGETITRVQLMSKSER